jgi:hypothetical protein
MDYGRWGGGRPVPKGRPQHQKEVMSLAPIAVGAAVVTNAGKLFAKRSSTR